MMTMMILVPPILLCLLVTQVASVPILKQVQVVTRHGARTPLTKAATTLQEASATLTPIGQKHLYELGIWLKTKYAGLGVIDKYNTTFVRLESSDYDRTIVSALMLAQGLFSGRPSNELLPTSARNTDIPVYTNIKVNDITIRAYDKCPPFLEKLVDLYASEPFLAIEHDHSPLLTFLANVSDFQSYVVEHTIPLSNIWNVYDAMNVADTECAANFSSTSCQALANPSLATLLNDTQWTELQSIANYAELAKYRQTGGKLLGSNLLRKIYTTMNTATSSKKRKLQSKSTDVMQTFILYSAHYPTILGLLNSMGESDLKIDVIPNYATALIFELYADNETLQDTVVTYYKAGLQNSTETLVLKSVCAGQVFCPLESFGQIISTGVAGATTAEDWCTECSNDSADVCLKAKLTALTTASNTVPVCSNKSVNNGIIAGTFFGGLAVGVGVMLLSVWLYSVQKQQKDTHSPGKEGDPQVEYGDAIVSG